MSSSTLVHEAHPSMAVAATSAGEKRLVSIDEVVKELQMSGSFDKWRADLLQELRNSGKIEELRNEAAQLLANSDVMQRSRTLASSSRITNNLRSQFFEDFRNCLIESPITAKLSDTLKTMVTLPNPVAVQQQQLDNNQPTQTTASELAMQVKSGVQDAFNTLAFNYEQSLQHKQYLQELEKQEEAARKKEMEAAAAPKPNNKQLSKELIRRLDKFQHRGAASSFLSRIARASTGGSKAAAGAKRQDNEEEAAKSPAEDDFLGIKPSSTQQSEQRYTPTRHRAKQSPELSAQRKQLFDRQFNNNSQQQQQQGSESEDLASDGAQDRNAKRQRTGEKTQETTPANS